MTTAIAPALLPKAWVNEARVNELTRAVEVLAGVRDDVDLPDALRTAAGVLGPAVVLVSRHLAEQARRDVAAALTPGEVSAGA